MQKRVLRDDVIFVIEEFMSLAECARFISASESNGYEEATITTRRGFEMRKDIRNNDRMIYDDHELAQQLFERASPFLAQQWLDRQLVGLNERFRFYRYQPGQRFAPHFDGAFDRGNGERSEFSFLIYLNEDFEGGATNFFDPFPLSVTPRTGDALVFFHSQLHEGAVLERGTKYVLRTDVMYTVRE